ncbi:MAG: hypothetical protein KDD63_03920 [Bacteroidetes bacterium]|nr:hypothetical protein [Bacteroidota bacterium]
MIRYFQICLTGLYVLGCSILVGQKDLARYPATFNGSAQPRMILESDGRNLLIVNQGGELQMVLLDEDFRFQKGEKINLKKAEIPAKEPDAILGYPQFLDLFYLENSFDQLVRIRISKRNHVIERKLLSLPQDDGAELLAVKKHDRALYIFTLNPETRKLAIYEFRDEIRPQTYTYVLPELGLLAEGSPLTFPIMDELPEVIVRNNAGLCKLYFEEERFILTLDFRQVLKTKTIFLDKKSGEVNSMDHWLGEVEAGEEFATNSLLYQNMLFQVKATHRKLALSVTNLESRHLAREWEWRDKEEVRLFFEELKKETFSYLNPVFDSEFSLLDELAKQVSLGMMMDSEGMTRLILGSYRREASEKMFFALDVMGNARDSSHKSGFFPAASSFEALEGDLFFMASFGLDWQNINQKMNQYEDFPIEKLYQYTRRNYLLEESRAQMIFQREHKWYLGFLDGGNYIIREFE